VSPTDRLDTHNGLFGTPSHYRTLEMNDHASILTPRQRWFITGGIVLLVMTARVAVILTGVYFFGIDLKGEIASVLGGIGLIASLPVGIAVVERMLAREKRPWWLESLVLLGYGAFSGVMGMLSYFVIVPMPDFELAVMTFRISYPLVATASMLLLSIAIGVISAIQRYRLALDADLRRLEFEAAAAKRTRELIEQRMRPSFVIGVLERIAFMLDSDDPGAEPLLLRLARHERRLLQEVPPEASAPAPAPRSEPQWSAPITGALVLYFVVSIFTDMQFIAWQGTWNLLAMTLTSAVLWLAIGPLLNWTIGRAVRFRFIVAIGSAAIAALTATAIVTAGSIFTLWKILDAVDFAEAPMFFSFITWRNALTACVIAASGFAAGFARVMFEARAGAARAREQLFHAEARELEARFHPHFLFNALGSIAALIRSDPAAAATMCRRLAGLVSKTIACAGADRWPLEEELDLVSDYLSVQTTRFGDRLRIVSWSIQGAARQEAIPRLILQPLIENIFKHAVAVTNHSIDAGVSVRRRRQRLDIRVWNTTNGVSPRLSHGRGLAFVSRRVREAGGEISIAFDNGQFNVHCSIPVIRPTIEQYAHNAIPIQSDSPRPQSV
jgi:MFS family permease